MKNGTLESADVPIADARVRRMYEGLSEPEAAQLLYLRTQLHGFSSVELPVTGDELRWEHRLRTPNPMLDLLALVKRVGCPHPPWLV